MTGPEQYSEAERMLLVAQSEMEGYASTRDEATEAIHLAQAQWAQQRAQVHATLAQAAATERLAKAVENLPTYEGMLAVYTFGGGQ